MTRILAFVPMVLVPYVLLVTPIVLAHCWLHHDNPIAVVTAQIAAPVPPPTAALPPPGAPPFLGS